MGKVFPPLPPTHIDTVWHVWGLYTFSVDTIYRTGLLTDDNL